MVKARGVKLVMSQREQAIGFKKRRVARHGLVQQIDGLQGVRLLRVSQNIIGARIELESSDIARRRLFDGGLFAGRKFCLQLVGDSLSDLALNGEHIREIAVISLSPQMPVGA